MAGLSVSIMSYDGTEAHLDRVNSFVFIDFAHGHETG